VNTILPEEYAVEKQLKTQIDHYFSKHSFGARLKDANIRKKKGYTCLYLFKFIFLLVFNGKNLYRTLLSENDDTTMEKSAAYRFLNSPRYNWRRLLLNLCSSIIEDVLEPLNSRNHNNVLILDDTLYSRARSKSVELLANVYDHVHHRYVRGFRMLTLGWSDGNTFLPLAFSLLSSAKKKNRICEANKTIDKRTVGHKRRLESAKKATDVMFELIEQAKKHNIKAKYVLFDSWFSFPSTICKVLNQHGLHVICRLKSIKNVHYYTHSGEKITLSKLYKDTLKKRGKAKILASVIVKIADKNNQMLPVRIVFVRSKTGGKKWLALLSTNWTQTDEEIVRIYGKRWQIEVFFKATKSLLSLGKEFQGRTYDSMIAHTTIVCCRYIMLALENRESVDDRTFGHMFYYHCDEIRDIAFAEAFHLLMLLLKEALKECLDVEESVIDELFEAFFTSLPAYLKQRLRFLSCES
jgi:hypothetical protein